MGGFERPAKAQEWLGIKRDALYGLCKRGLLTQPVKLIGGRASGWPRYELEILSAARAAGRSDAQIRLLVVQLHAAREETLAKLVAQLPGGNGLPAQSPPARAQRRAQRMDR